MAAPAVPGLSKHTKAHLRDFFRAQPQHLSAVVRLLRPLMGGVLHVHENVHEEAEEVWCTRVLPATLLRLGREAGAPWAGAEGDASVPVRVLHVERVKSYAPRVWHVVVDVECGGDGR